LFQTMFISVTIGQSMGAYLSKNLSNYVLSPFRAYVTVINPKLNLQIVTFRELLNLFPVQVLTRSEDR